MSASAKQQQEHGDAEFAALKAVVSALEDLEPPTRYRVLKAAEAFLGASTPFAPPMLPPAQPPARGGQS
jgi:hypothetical protein